MNNTNQQQSFHTAFPFDFAFANQYQGEELPVLYITDNANSDSTLLSVTLTITPANSQQYTMRGCGFQTPATIQPTTSSGISGLSSLVPSNVSFIPSENKYNLAILFRPGVLKAAVQNNFSNILQSALTKAFPQNFAAVNGPLIRSSDGALIWYCAFRDDVSIPKNGISFTLEGVSASSSVGSRSTQVAMKIANLFLTNANTPLSFQRSVHVDILNHQGHTSAPLYFGIIGSNRLQNGMSNNLEVYFESVDRVPIQFGPGTAFDFSFTAGGLQSNFMHFGTPDELTHIDWKPGQNPPAVSAGPDTSFDSKFNSNLTNSVNKNTNEFTFTAEFLPVESCSFENPEWLSLQQSQQALNSDLQSTQQFLTSNASPLPIAQSIIDKQWNILLQQPAPDDFFSQNRAIFEQFSYWLYCDPNSGNPHGTPQQIIPILNDRAQQNTGSDQNNPIVLQPADVPTIPYIDYTQPFQTSNWDNAVIAMNAAIVNLKAKDGISARYNESAISQAGTYTTNRWGNSYFVNFLTLNFKPLIDTIVNYVKPLDFFSGYQNQLVCSRVLYEYLYAMYKAYISYRQQEINTFASTFLLNLNSPFTDTFWSQALQQACQLYENQQANSSSTLSQDSANLSASISGRYKESDPWFDREFLDFSSINLKQVCSTLYTGSNVNPLVQVKSPDTQVQPSVDYYITPGKALWDYLLSSYQLNSVQQALTDTPKTLQYYINPSTCVFRFTNLNLSGNDGMVLLNVRTRNLPGYWDSTFQIPIVKETPLGVQNNQGIPAYPKGSMLIQQGENKVFAQRLGDPTPHANLNNIPSLPGTWVETSRFWSDTDGNYQRYTYVMFVKVSDDPQPTQS